MPGSAKRMAATASPPSRFVRKASVSPGGPSRPTPWPSPRDRTPQSVEERLSILEKGFIEHTHMNLDMRRELFAKSGELLEQTKVNEK